MTTRDRIRSHTRGGAEWATFAISALVLVVVIVVLLVDLTGTPRPASPIATVEPGGIALDGDRYRVAVAVRNEGDRAATNAQVVAELETDGATEQGEQTIAFLGADETVHLVFFFAGDPHDGDLTVTVTGYAET